MKKSMLIISMVCAASAAWATIVTDDFNRADTTYSTDGSTIGANWVNSDASDLWRITGNQLQTDLISSPSMLHNTEQQLNGTSFTTSIEASTDLAGKYAGIIFNYQDASNYYVLRFKTDSKAIHLLSVVSGTNQTTQLKSATATFTAGTMYTLTVTSDSAYDFDFAITETGSSTLLNTTTNFVDINSNFTGGYAGVYAVSGDATYDNFSVEVIPEPATIGMVAICSAGLLFIRRRLIM